MEATEDFINQGQMKALKELGFNEEFVSYFYDITRREFGADIIRKGQIYDQRYTPTKSLIFRWFREKYKIEPEIVSDMFGYVGSIVDRNKLIKIQLSPTNLFQTYEEAENACIDKLIAEAEQEKNKKNFKQQQI